MRLIQMTLSCLILLASPLWAACAGQDLRTSLTPREQALFDARLAETPYAEGNHWRATRGDEILHLIGTVHLSDSRLDGPAARLTPLIQNASLLLLEMTKAEEAELQNALVTRTDMLLLPDSTLPDLLSEQDWKTLSEAMEQRGMPSFMAAKMRPWYVSMLLSIPTCLMDQLSEGNGLDARLEAVATAADIPTMALEPFDTAFSAFSNMPFETQLLMIRSALSAPGADEDLFETLLSAYFAEAHGAGQIALEVLSPRLTPLSSEENDTIFESVDKVLITDRNISWIPVLLEALNQTDGYVVAGFGAAHLTGTIGILTLLEAKGFTLERLPF